MLTEYEDLPVTLAKKTCCFTLAGTSSKSTIFIIGRKYYGHQAACSFSRETLTAILVILYIQQYNYMKTYFTFFIILFSLSSFSQPSGITQLNATNVEGGINVNVVAYWGGVFDYVGHSYVINNDAIDVEVCYFPTPFLMETEVSNDFFIPINLANHYTINVTAYFSSSEQFCTDLEVWDTSSTAILTINENFQKDRVVIFPNPAKEFISVQSNSIDINDIEIYDHLGRLVKTTKESIIDLSNFGDGIYYFRITLENDVLLKKIIVGQ
jgi:hypothetical protein